MGGHQSTQCPHEIITRLSSRGRGWFLSRAHPGLQLCIGSGIHRQNGVPVLAAKPLLVNTVACTCRGSNPIPMFSTANAQQDHQNKHAHPDQNAPKKPRNPTETSPPLTHTREVSNVVWPNPGSSRSSRPEKTAIFFGVKPLPFLPSVYHPTRSLHGLAERRS